MPRTKAKPARRRPAPLPPALLDPAGALNSLNLMVGNLAGKLEAHIDAVAHDRAERDNDGYDASAYRAEIRGKLDVLKEKIIKVEGHASRIETLEAAASDFKTFRNKLAGGIVVVGVIWPLALDWLKRKFFA